MRYFLDAAKVLLLDLASTAVFLVLYLLTHNTILAVAVAIAFGVAQIAIQIARRKPVEAMEWLSLFLVVTAGAATLVSNDPRFVLFKPSAIYAVIGVVMLKPGWMTRYLPPIASAVVPDVATSVGFAWAALMFLSAVLNAFIAFRYSAITWALVMPIFGLVSKALLFAAGFVMLRLQVGRRLRAMPDTERDALLSSTGMRQPLGR